SFQKRGLRVAILDADFGMANVDILLGVKANYSIYDLLFDDKTIEDIEVDTPYGIKLFAGGRGFKEFDEIDDEKRNKLLGEFSKVSDIDILIIDTGAGISPNVIRFIEYADEVIIVTNEEPTALTDAYSLIKVINKNNIDKNLDIVINMASNLVNAMRTFTTLKNISKKFLNIDINFLGYLIKDNKVRNSVIKQKPFIELYPNSEIALCIQKISNSIIGNTEKVSNNSITGFFNNLFKAIRR
ncbi:MAG TPA: MinD/ParA family protein, partial [Clostridiaceae bacterium]|nr:MinD/ParA family protein [Clostridiaceae bacterium]